MHGYLPCFTNSVDNKMDESVLKACQAYILKLQKHSTSRSTGTNGPAVDSVRFHDHLSIQMSQEWEESSDTDTPFIIEEFTETVRSLGGWILISGLNLSELNPCYLLGMRRMKYNFDRRALIRTSSLSN